MPIEMGVLSKRLKQYAVVIGQIPVKNLALQNKEGIDI